MVVLSYIYALHEETKNPDLEVFFDIQFNHTGNPNANVENFSGFRCSYILDLTSHICNKKTSVIIYRLFGYYINLKKKMVPLNQLSTQFRVDF